MGVALSLWRSFDCPAVVLCDKEAEEEEEEEYEEEEDDDEEDEVVEEEEAVREEYSAAHAFSSSLSDNCFSGHDSCFLMLFIADQALRFSAKSLQQSMQNQTWDMVSGKPILSPLRAN